MASGDIYIYNCAKLYPAAPDPEAVAQQMKRLIDNDRALRTGPITVAHVVRTVVNGAILSIYTRPLGHVERGTYEGGH